MLFLPFTSQTVTPSPPAMMRFGVSPRACVPIWVEGWKKWSRSQAASSLDWSSMAVPLRSGCVEAEVFEIGEGFNAVARTFASKAGLFCPAERDRRAGDLHAVDRDHAVVERAAHPELARAVLGDKIGDEAVFGG